MTNPGQPPVPEGELRVSDSERDATLTVLSQQAAAGRLTLDELEERAGLVLAAKTRADLATVTRDLPAEAPATPDRRKTPVRWFVAIMGGSRGAAASGPPRWSTAWPSWAATRSTCGTPRSTATA